MDRASRPRDQVSAEGVRRALGDLAERISVEVIPCCASTNTLLKERAASAEPWHVLIARRQTGGRGRMGRHFFSPEGTGLYMSVLLRPDLPSDRLWLVTPAAAVAVCRAAEELVAAEARIKWVNDVLIRGRKVCGILTEAGTGPGGPWAVLGVGINVTEPEGGFPPEAAEAGAVFPEPVPGRMDALAAAFLRHLYALCASGPGRAFVEEYRARSCLNGREVTVLGPGGAQRALALEVDGDCRLRVRYPDGREEALFSGEVSIRPAGEPRP